MKESRKVAEIDETKAAKKLDKIKEREERKQNLLELKTKKKIVAAKNKLEREAKNGLKKIARAATPEGNGKRGRKKKILPNIVFPKTEFTLNDLA